MRRIGTLALDMAERLSKYDAIFYFTDTQRTAMQAGVGFLFGGPIDFERYVEWVAPRIERVPRMRMVLKPEPLHLRMPRWESAAEFDLSELILPHTLAAPGNEDQLRSLFEELFHQRLPHTKPLWRLHVINGLESGGAAFMLQFHHCMADAGATFEIMSALMEAAPMSDSAAVKPTRGGLDREAHAQRPLHSVREWLTPDGRRRAAVMARYARMKAARFPFTRPASGRMKFTWRRIPVAEVRAAASAFDATATDVVLAGLGSAMDAYATREGVSVNGRHLLLQIPANVRLPDQYGKLGNELTMLPGVVPLGMDDPVERLRRVAAFNRELKELKMAPVIHGMMGTAFGLATPPGQALLCKLMVSKLHLHLARLTGLPPQEHALLSSVVLPPFTYSADGQPFTGCVNLIAGQFNMGVAISPIVYGSDVMITLSVDAAHIGEPDGVMEDVLAAVDELRVRAG